MYANYLRPLDPMQQKQKDFFFNILGSREKLLQNFTFDLDVLKSISLDKVELEEFGGLIHQRSFAR